MTASQSRSRRVCPECDVEFGDPAEVRSHYFETHLVTESNGSVGDRDTSPAEPDEPSDPPSRDPPGAEARPADPRSGSGSGSRTVSEADLDRSTSRRLPDLFVALFVLIFLAIPVVALVLALA